MKKIVLPVLVCLTISGIGLNLSSCGKETSTQPVVALITGAAYVSKDTSLYRGTTFNLGITASKTGTGGLLTSCKISRSINGGTDSTIQEMSFVTEYFSQFYSYQAGDSGNTERYTFTVGKQDGLTSSVSVTITDI